MGDIVGCWDVFCFLCVLVLSVIVLFLVLWVGVCVSGAAVLCAGVCLCSVSMCVAMYAVPESCVSVVGMRKVCDAWWNSSAVVSVSVTCRKCVYAWVNVVPCSWGSILT